MDAGTTAGFATIVGVGAYATIKLIRDSYRAWKARRLGLGSWNRGLRAAHQKGVSERV